MSSKKKKTQVENMTQFTIDDGIPVPPRTNGAGRPSKYPFLSLKAGQSFFVSAESGKAESIRSAMSRFNKRNAEGIKLTARSEEGGTRIWRME